MVPRYLRKGIIERVNSKGEIFTHLNEDSVRQALSFFAREGVEAIAVSLLFAFLNPAHEIRVAEICREEMGDIPVSLSSIICPEFREYERTCTTVMNSYLGPVIAEYMDNPMYRVTSEYGRVTLHIMQSNGGTMTAETAKHHSAHLINSGPAGGAIAAAFISKLTGNETAVGADMGGTTFDISIIDKSLRKRRPGEASQTAPLNCPWWISKWRKEACPALSMKASIRKKWNRLVCRSAL